MLNKQSRCWWLEALQGSCDVTKILQRLPLLHRQDIINSRLYHFKDLTKGDVIASVHEENKTDISQIILYVPWRYSVSPVLMLWRMGHSGWARLTTWLLVMLVAWLPVSPCHQQGQYKILQTINLSLSFPWGRTLFAIYVRNCNYNSVVPIGPKAEGVLSSPAPILPSVRLSVRLSVRMT